MGQKPMDFEKIRRELHSAAKNRNLCFGLLGKVKTLQRVVAERVFDGQGGLISVVFSDGTAITADHERNDWRFGSKNVSWVQPGL